MTTYTEADFDGLSWHDCLLRRVELVTGDVTLDDWTSDLALDIDFITGTSRDAGSGASPGMTTGTLVFHGVTDLHIQIDLGDCGIRSPYTRYPSVISSASPSSTRRSISAVRTTPGLWP